MRVKQRLKTAAANAQWNGRLGGERQVMSGVKARQRCEGAVLVVMIRVVVGKL